MYGYDAATVHHETNGLRGVRARLQICTRCSPTARSRANGRKETGRKRRYIHPKGALKDKTQAWADGARR